MNETNSHCRQQRYGVLLLIFILTVISFLPTFTNGFQLDWDDQWMVVNSQTVGHWNKYLLLSIFMNPSHGQLAPINQLMYTALYRAFGFNPLAFHIASIVLHLVNVYLLYVGLRIVLRDCTQLPSWRIEWIVVITTLLFAIHPVQVESVAWVSASKIPLSTTFYFIGAILLIIYIREKRWGSYAGVLLMQLMAYLSKEQAVVFPLFAALLFVWYGIRPRSKNFWVGLLPIGVLGLACVAHEVFYVSNYDQYIQGDTYAWWQRIVFCVYSIMTYFFKWLVPINLNWMYLFPMEIGERMPWWLMLYPAFVFLLVFAFWKELKKPLVLSALAFFFIHLLLVIHITALPRASVVADRYLYVSIISLNFLLAYFLTGLRGWLKRPKMTVAILSVIIVLLAGMSYDRTKDWKDSKTLKSVYAVENSFSEQSVTETHD